VKEPGVTSDEIGTEEVRDLPVGRLVKGNLERIFALCEAKDGELDHLLDLAQCKETFRLSFPFCRLADSFEHGSDDNTRFWSDVYLVSGRRVRVTSQWYSARHTAPFLRYLEVHGLGDAAEAANYAAAESARRRSAAGARYRRPALGNAQNAFIRTLLSSIGEESFTEVDWQATQEYFANRCAYCQSAETLVMDHAVPINRSSLGEHRLGNLIPACDSCNSRKGHRDFRTFDGADDVAVARISAFMESRGYVPLGDNEDVKRNLEAAFVDIKMLLDHYSDQISSLTPELVVHPPVLQGRSDAAEAHGK
jgi:5-methylcytosine-specific restriction endonuclease McrA